ncbi:MAG: phosphoglycerate kinase [Actinobacteria bacterium]|jgi:phosphoglycerate kinase|nr:phosphoglycerate kinase [Actinomycetota bacterium]MCL6094541.1 phosphoglycerate kinase [Actinomycetota bacterium]
MTPSTLNADPWRGIPTLEDLPDPRGKRVLLRADFNVPLAEVRLENGELKRVVEDDFRIRAALPTIQWLTDAGAIVTACSHLGRPKGKPNPALTMDPVAEVLGRLAPSVRLMENLRFDPGEEANDVSFVRKLISGQDLYVNDAFGSCHRAHASVVGPPSFLPSAAGRLLQKEVSTFSKLLNDPQHPFVAVLGGAKVSDKIGLIRSLLERVDTLIIGGAMAFTFMAANGHEVGDSLVERDKLSEVSQLSSYSKKIVLPVDFVALEPGGKSGGHGEVGSGSVSSFEDNIPPGWRGLDIGPRSVDNFSQYLEKAALVFWNGPMGLFEDERFSVGTKKVGEAVANCSGFTVVGGGDTVHALDQFGLSSRIGFVSSGGGASLELLEYGDLPGLAALRSSKGAS